MPRVTTFTHRKRERETSDASEQPEQQSAALPDDRVAHEPIEIHGRSLPIFTSAAIQNSAAQRLSIHARLAQMLWSTDYVGLLLQELLQYADVAVCDSLS